MKKVRQWFSVQITKNPARVILLCILLFNILFIILSAVVISGMSLSGTEKMNFLQAAFCTITMILDAGCVQFVIENIGTAGVLTSLFCLVVIIVGMISFTGAVIGYTTNYISEFISNSNSGSRKLTVSNHVVILNWNSRASEIINDLLYTEEKQTVVVLSSTSRDTILKEIDERLSDTIKEQNVRIAQLEKAYKESTNEVERAQNYKKYISEKENKVNRNHVTVLVKEGDVFSYKQLEDISTKNARSVIILGHNITDGLCKYDAINRLESNENGNYLTVKTLMQVAEICGSDASSDDQKIIVEITDDWTLKLVDQIISQYESAHGKCKIVPLKVNQVLGQILSQFSLMPELNIVYRDLFSNKGAKFIPMELGEGQKDLMEGGEVEMLRKYMGRHSKSIPLTNMVYDSKEYLYVSSTSADEARKTDVVRPCEMVADLNRDYWIANKYVIILGHNSKLKDIMQGFVSFRNEWLNPNSEDDILNIIVIDEEKSLEKMNYFKDYPFVTQTVAASIYEDTKICESIERFTDSHEEDTSILILSDDAVASEDIDASALAYFIYVQNIIKKKVETDPNFNVNSIDPIVEILDPKHFTLVNNYCGEKSVATKRNNVVISNRFISKMITQIGEKEALYKFYVDILKYDDDNSAFESKEIYAKKVNRLFNTLPPKCKVGDLIRSVFEASVNPSLPDEKKNPTITLGYVNENEDVHLFELDQYTGEDEIELHECDKLIVFSNH